MISDRTDEERWKEGRIRVNRWRRGDEEMICERKMYRNWKGEETERDVKNIEMKQREKTRIERRRERIYCMVKGWRYTRRRKTRIATLEKSHWWW